MYSSSSVLSLRAKGSLYHYHHPHHHRCFSGDRAAEICGCCCSLGSAHLPSAAAAVGFSDRASVFASPSLLYGYWLRQSALIRWAPSRIIVSSGGGAAAAAAARYNRLKAAWDGDLRPDGEGRRWRKCGNSRVSGRVRVSDEGIQDMLGLLAEVEECFGQDDGVAGDGAAEDTYVKEKVGFKSHGGSRRRFYDGESDASREDDRKLNSSYQSASSSSSISGDSRRSKDFRRRGRDESSSSHCRNDEIAEKEVREVRKHDEDSRLRRRYHASDSILGLDGDTRKKEERTGDRDDKTASLTGSVLQSRERYVQKDQRFTGRKETKEELQKVSKTSHVRQTSATERSVVDKNMVNVIKEETSAAALLEVVRKQQDEMIQLRKDYQDLLRTTQVHNVSATKASASCSIFNTKVENLSENSTLPMGLLEEVQRQRSDIEQLNENYRELIRAYKMQENIMIRESNSTESFGTVLENRDETSTSAVNLVGNGTVHYYNMDKQTFDDSRTASSILTRTNELQKYHQQLKTSDIHEGDIQTTTNYKKGQSKSLEDREEKAISAINLVEEVQGHHTDTTQDQQKVRHTDLERNTHKVSERAGIYSTSTQTASRSWRHHATTISDQQECTSSAVKWTREREEQVGNVNEKLIGNIDLRRNSQKPADIVKTHKNGATKALRTQDRVKTTVKDQAECSTLVQNLVKLTKDERVQIDQHVIEEINVSKDTQTCINISEAFVGEADNATATFSDHLRNEDGEQATQQFRLRNDSQQRAPESFEGDPVNVSDLQVLSTKKTKKTDDHPSLVFIQEPKEKQKNNLVEGTLGASSGTSESWYISGPMQTHELDYHTENDGLDPLKDDVLESARRLAKSSSHYIGEFVDQLNQKVSVSEEVDITSFNSPETQIDVSQQSFSQKAATEQEDEVGKEEEPQEYSSRSEVAGPSDEIWDVRGASSQEPSPTEKQEEDSSSVQILATAGTPASTSGAIIKRSSKSLWSYIADIVRMGWRPHNSSQKSTLKSDTRSSSNESLNSDAWYSGHEPEDDQEENVKKGRVVTKTGSELNKAAVSKPHSRTSSVSGRVASEVRKGKKRMQDELDASIPTEIIGGSYVSDGSPPAPSPESLVPVDAGKGIQGTTSVITAIVPSAVATASQSGLLGSTSVSTSEEEMEIYGVHVTEVGSTKPEEGQKAERISEVVGLGGKDVELKQRKLQRKKQVLREEFEEWEEAYKLETEQRKVDEFFMREALLEAKKAADMWEVPVGAVLVQDGKIIARGCNLVEDLRDSTAHAEMICIREASSFLRTWRLAGTTLYVTLEPCPMCAGAILQARIDAVVWGAPNKLLGADGSWVSRRSCRKQARTSTTNPSAWRNPSRSIVEEIFPIPKKPRSKLVSEPPLGASSSSVAEMAQEGFDSIRSMLKDMQQEMHSIREEVALLIELGL